MNPIEEAKKLRPLIEEAAKSLSDEEAFSGYELFSNWNPDGFKYKLGDRVQYNKALYKCLQDHTSQADWKPSEAVSLWVEVPDPAIEWPEWKQPAGAHDAYNKGDKVTHDGAHWISDIDANVYEPGVYGWTESN